MRKAYVVKKGGKNVIPPSLSPSQRNMLVVNVGRLKNICLLFITPSFPIIFCKDGPIVIKIKKIQQKRVLGVFDLGTAIWFFCAKASLTYNSFPISTKCSFTETKLSSRAFSERNFVSFGACNFQDLKFVCHPYP